MTKDTDKDAEYLGDGVYAYNDGYHIILELTAQNPKERIALEPAVFDRLIKYKKGLEKKYNGTD